jgi:adenylate cyclase
VENKFMTDLYGFFTHRRLRLLSGVVMFAYIAIHLLNHGLGIFSLAMAESGLRIEMAFWRTPIMTLLLYGAVVIHFLLALWTLYSRADWKLPWVEILRLTSGFSFPLLLINHAVTTRLGDALFGINPTYALIIANLLAAGMQGMQIALLAPGWLHGCLGLWITLRRFRTMQRIKGLLAALVVIIPLLAATGFLRMTSEVLAMGAPPTGSDAMLHKTALASWGTNLMQIYLGAILLAFLFGRLHCFWPRLFRAVSHARGINVIKEFNVSEPRHRRGERLSLPQIKFARTDGATHEAQAALRYAHGAEWPFHWAHPSLTRGAYAPHCNIADCEKCRGDRLYR